MGALCGVNRNLFMSPQEQWHNRSLSTRESNKQQIYKYIASERDLTTAPRKSHNSASGGGELAGGADVEAQFIPCLATIKLAMQSGTLVPAARKVMPMMTSGIPRVYPIIVTCRRDQGQRSG